MPHGDIGDLDQHNSSLEMLYDIHGVISREVFNNLIRNILKITTTAHKGQLKNKWKLESIRIDTIFTNCQFIKNKLLSLTIIGTFPKLDQAKKSWRYLFP